ncbi:MAG: LicD family protein, partial [Candidatus Methanomethylophilaceae archaeon]|nr:LicD family protein [Candidatus Methanomethylophilaceae archaeon]
MLDRFDEICTREGLIYWLHAGTLLGSVRGKDLIPWDDDVDVTMLRRDFDRLLENCDEFKGRYFL